MPKLRIKSDKDAPSAHCNGLTWHKLTNQIVHFDVYVSSD